MSSETDPGWHVEDTGAGGCKGPAGAGWAGLTLQAGKWGLYSAGGAALDGPQIMGGRGGESTGECCQESDRGRAPADAGIRPSQRHTTSFSPQSSPVGVCLLLMFQRLSCGPEACGTIPKVTRPGEVELACRPRGVLFLPSPSPAPL